MEKQKGGIFIWVLILAGLVFGGWAIKLLFFPVNTLNKEVDLMYDVQDKVLDADNAIYNYEWFKQRYEDIEANKRNYDNAKAQHQAFLTYLSLDRSTWAFEDRNEDNRLRSVKLGLQNHLEDLIADYNARAKMATRNIFADNVLPDFVDALTFIRK